MSSNKPSSEPIPRTAAPKSGHLHKKFNHKIYDLIPPWVTTNIRSVKSWKLLVRCWVASWASFVVILPEKSITALGNASFFVLLPSLMLPPNVPVQLFVFLLSTVLIGMLLGWAVGCAAMRAALAARNQDLLRETLLRAKESAAGAVNPDAQFELSIFLGTFLDIRSSAVYGCFLGIAVFFFALIRAYAPRLAIMSVFGSIIIDVFCCYGPLFPIAQYTIVSSLLISASTYLAIGLVVCIFIFPETMLHRYLDSIGNHLGDLENYLRGFEEVVKSFGFSDSDDGNVEVAEGEDKEKVAQIGKLKDESADVDAEKEELREKSAALRSKIIGAHQSLTAQSAFLNAEFTWGRWNGRDAKGIENPLLTVVVRLAGLHSFSIHAKRYLQNISTSLSQYSASTTADDDRSSRLTLPSQKNAEPKLTNVDGSSAELEKADTNDAEDSDILRQLHSHPEGPPLQEVIPILLSSTEELRFACADAISAIRAIVNGVNTDRYNFRCWRDKKEGLDMAQLETRLNTSNERLRSAIEAFTTAKRMEVIEIYLPHVRLMQQQNRNTVARSLIIVSLFQANLLSSANGIVRLLSYVKATSQNRKRNRLWMPLGIGNLWRSIISRGNGDSASTNGGINDTEKMLGEDDRVDVDDVEKGREGKYNRDPDGLPPTNIFQKFAYIFYKLYLWLRTPEAIFCIKYVIVTIALWVPSVCKSSAYFAYTERSIWAIVMAQTTLNIFISDQIYNYVARLIGTFVGLIVGLLVWYIGNGNGSGSPYGAAAVMGVVLVPVVFIRIFAPPTVLIPNLMFVATLALIVGYSWQDGHLLVIGSPGRGWDVAWRRWVLVVIGCAASFIVMLFPPTSGKKAVRLRNSSVIKEISSIYAFLLSQWVSENEHSAYVTQEKDSEGNLDYPRWAESYRKRIIVLATQIQGLKQMTAVAKWEGGIRGRWPIEEYSKLVDTESQMLASLSQLAGALSHLNPEWRASVNSRTRILNPHFISESLSIFALVSQSLQTGQAIHQVLPTSLLDRALYHELKSYPHAQKPEQSTRMADLVDRVRSIEFMFFSAAIAAVSQITVGLDELQRITRILCGEIPFEGFSDWKERYERAQQL